MARCDVGVVGQHNAAFLTANVGLIVENGVFTARLAVLSNHDQARLELWFHVRGRRRRRGLTWISCIDRRARLFRPPDQARAAELTIRHLRRVRAAAARADEDAGRRWGGCGAGGGGEGKGAGGGGGGGRNRGPPRGGGPRGGAGRGRLRRRRGLGRGTQGTAAIGTEPAARRVGRSTARAYPLGGPLS